MQKPKVFLFDLGGVIVRWVGLDALADITGLTREDVSSRFASSQTFSDYEIGHCGDDVFADALRSEFDFKMTGTEAKALWNSWVQECYPGTKDMLRDLRKDYTISCLSNTNALHWGYLPTHIDVDEYFDSSFASHLIHAAKPDLKSYRIAIEAIGEDLSDIWFFDDTMVNVEAAKSAGLTAFHVDRAVGVIPKLQELGLLT